MALRAISRACLADLKQHGRAASGGDAEALHHVRIALTRLRTAIRFFAPGIDNAAAWEAVQRQASWLGWQSGAVRDIDVALARQHRKNAAANGVIQRWRQHRDRLDKRLRRALHSARFHRFIDTLSRRSGPAIDGGRLGGPVERTAAGFSIERLRRWRSKLLANGRKLDRMGWRKRHRLRIRAKRYRYALEWSSPLLPKARPLLRRQLAQARIIQNALGRLNDAHTHQAQAKALKIDPLPSMIRLGRKKSEQRVLEDVRGAFAELGRLKPL
jgi:CHAD domain-containing protein